MTRTPSHDSLRYSPETAPRVDVAGMSLPIIALQRFDALVLNDGADLDGRIHENVRIHLGETDVVLRRVKFGPTTTDQGRKTAMLQPVDDESRAGLWMLRERLVRTSRDDIDAGAATGVDSIPARGQYTEQARLERLDFLRAESGEELAALDTTTLVPKRLTSNIENMIGAVEVPVGLAGPLLFHGDHARGVIYAPLATTEGTLVASAARGARAITRAGGVTTHVLAQRMTRAPLFVLESLQGAMMFADWIRDHYDAIRDKAAEVSRFAKLVSAEPHLVGRHVHIPFVYETGDAAGQNMTTSCTWHACQWIMQQMKYFDAVRFENYLIDSNLSSDKKVTFQSFLQGRGTRVVAEAVLDRETLQHVLKVTPEQLTRTFQHFLSGAMQVGMIGHNVNVANVLAAMFIATGQDVGCVHESSLGQLNVELTDDGVHAAMLMPSLIVGTVGGGTHLPRQNELLASMGCAGPGKVSRLAEIIAGFSLALDLSTMAAIASGQFAHAHERLGRNRPIQWFQKDDLDEEFVEVAMREALDDPSLRVTGLEPLDEVEMGSSIITELTARNITKLIGHFPYRVDFEGARERGPIDIVAKVKPIDDEVVMMSNNLAAMCGPRLANAFNRFKAQTDFQGCDARELALYAQNDPRFTRHAPRAYGIANDASRELYVLLLERLTDVELLDEANTAGAWKPAHIEAAIRGLAELHSIWYGRDDELRDKPWIGFVHDAGSMTEMTELWDSLAVHAGEEFPGWISEQDLEDWRALIRTIDQWWPQFASHPKTLIHNDFNPRNICLRRDDNERTLCAYDWELATIGPPQRDLAEFLSFVLSDDVDVATVDRYVELHRTELERATGRDIPAAQWHDGYELSLRDFLVHRFGLYMMAHTFRHYGFMERVATTLRRLLRLEGLGEKGAA